MRKKISKWNDFLMHGFCRVIRGQGLSISVQTGALVEEGGAIDNYVRT